VRDELAVFRRARQRVRLRVVEVLQPMLEIAQKDVRFAQLPHCFFVEQPALGEKRQHRERRLAPQRRIPAWHALVIGIALNVFAFGVLWWGANLLAAALALAGSLIYVFIYTIWLKRSTPQNIVIGGAAGAIPPLVGWAAATGQLDLTALSLFAVIFFWTPPHFWALAQMIKADYARAHVPMLPVVAGYQSAKRQTIVYSVLTAAASVVPFFTASAGPVYLAAAVVLGIGLVGMALLDLETPGWTRRLWRFSLVYVAALFAVFALSPFIP
jgi:protoheme IX farnesyltransferase